MEWNKDDVRWAFKIFMELLPTGELKDNQECLYHYENNANVRLILEEIIEKEAEIKIFSLGDNLYLSPGVDNRYLGYSNEELRNLMKLQNNQELYLAYFSFLCLLAQFYSSDDQIFAARQFIPLEELEEIITNHVLEILEAPIEAVEALESEAKINLSSVADLWKEMPAFDDTLRYPRRGRNNRASFLIRVFSFLDGEGLVQITENWEIRLLPKLEHLVVRYYFHRQRKDYLLRILAEPLNFRIQSDEEIEYATD